MNDIATFTRGQAESLGFRALTTGYGTTQRDMMRRTIEDMRRGGIRCCLVLDNEGKPEVWRTSAGMKEVK